MAEVEVVEGTKVRIHSQNWRYNNETGKVVKSVKLGTIVKMDSNGYEVLVINPSSFTILPEQIQMRLV